MVGAARRGPPPGGARPAQGGPEGPPGPPGPDGVARPEGTAGGGPPGRQDRPGGPPGCHSHSVAPGVVMNIGGSRRGSPRKPQVLLPDERACPQPSRFR
jgi:hypothetical protein